MVRLALLALIAWPLLPAAAQEIGTAGPPPPAPAQPCTEVTAGSAKGYACLNQQLGAIARNTQRPSSADAPYSATSPSNVTGQYNQAATRERLGSNFGKSSQPQRPPPPNYGGIPR